MRARLAVVAALVFAVALFAAVVAAPRGEGFVDSPRARTHFLTFADGDACYVKFARRLAEQARTVAGFESARALDRRYLDADFVRRNAGVLAAPRGGGYWLWKPAVIFRYALEEARDGDVVVYCDSLYRFQDRRPGAGGSFAAYVAGELERSSHDVLVFKYKPEPNNWEYPEREWCKRDAYVVLGVADDDDATRDSTQAWGGFLAFRRTTRAMTFLAAFLTYCQDPRVLTDAPSVLGSEDAGMREHRHDQSVMSLVAKRWGIPMLAFPKGYMVDLRHAGEGGC